MSETAENIPRASVPKLPPELMDRIIDCSWEQKETLYNCALVCRAWLPRTRLNLFKSVVLRTRHHYDLFVRSSHAEHLRPFFASTFSLVIVGFEPFKDNLNLQWTRAFPLVLGGHLTGVECLVMHNMDWIQPVHPIVMTVGFALFTGVVELELSDCGFGTFGLFQHLICAFPNLRYLRVHQPQFQSYPPSDSSPEVLWDTANPSRPRLQSLTTIEVCPALFDWLCRTPSVESLSTLYLYATWDEAESKAGESLIEVLGGHLTDFRLSLCSETQLKSFADSHCLSACTNLEKLSLELPMKNYQADPQVHLPKLLSQIPSSSRLIRLEFSTRLLLQDSVIDFTHLGRIDQILEQQHFRDLLRVDMEIYVKCDGLPGLTRQQIAEGTQHALARLFRRGVRVYFVIMLSTEEPPWDLSRQQAPPSQ